MSRRRDSPEPFDFGPDDPTRPPSDEDVLDEAIRELLGDTPHPINWLELEPEDAEEEWLALNRWVHWLRRDYALPAAIIPPMWHRHPELVWELSALHTAWVAAYDPQQAAAGPLAWHRDFQAARERLRDWVAASGTRLDRDRSSRQTPWPGEPDPEPVVETTVIDREADFTQFLLDDVTRRRDNPASRQRTSDAAERDEGHRAPEHPDGA